MTTRTIGPDLVNGVEYFYTPIKIETATERARRRVAIRAGLVLSHGAVAVVAAVIASR